ALHTDFHLQFWSQKRRIDNRAADFRVMRFAARSQFHVSRAGTMTSLAVDALGESGVARRITVVTEQAAIVGKTREIRWSGIVVPGTHPPAPLLGVPSHRQFGKLPVHRLVQVGAGMIAGANRKGRFQLEYVYLGAAGVQLMTA